MGGRPAPLPVEGQEHAAGRLDAQGPRAGDAGRRPSGPRGAAVTREAALALEDGSVFVGEHFGAEVETEAEVVFNTSMTGYLEVCTDPSYRGQMVAMCHPQIGNYGVAASHRESVRPWLAALIVRELAEKPHHWESAGDLASYLAEFGVPGLQGIDTRALVRRLRSRGTMRAVLRLASPTGFDAASLDGLRSEAKAVADL